MGDDNTENIIPAKQDENRKPGTWLPGQSGNPAGRPPKGQALTDVMRQMLESEPNITKAIMAKLLEGAAKGDIAFIREVMDRMEGKPLQKNEVTGADGDRLFEIKVVEDKLKNITDKNE